MSPTGRLLLPTAALISACAGISILSTHDASQRPDEEPLRFGGGHRQTDELASSKKRTMNVQGHTVSKVSERWTGGVVYAIFTSAIERYHNNLLAQLETWGARPAAEGRYVAVGGENYPDEWLTDNILKSNCSDAMDGISCKEASLLAEGAARGADWLVVVGEDNYVFTRHVDEVLKSKDPDEAIAYGVVGCGQGMYCLDMAPNTGGFCGGAGYIISRAALQKLLADGAPALHDVYDHTTDPNDMTTSCALKRHGSVLRTIGGMMGGPTFRITDYEHMTRSENAGVLTAHYIKPAMLRWMHAQVEGAEESVKLQLEELAFDNGCARDMNTTHWASQYSSCWATSGGRKFAN